MCGGKAHMMVIFLKDLSNFNEEATFTGIAVFYVSTDCIVFYTIAAKIENIFFTTTRSQDMWAMRRLCSGLCMGYTVVGIYLVVS